MATVQEHLDHATANIGTALHHLEYALAHVQTQRFPQSWRSAIVKALSQTRDAHLQTGNISSCFAAHTDSTP